MAWLQLSVNTTPDTAPVLSNFFSDLGALSVTYMDANNQPVYEPQPGETRIWDKTRVIALFDDAIELEPIKTQAIRYFDGHTLEYWLQETIDDQLWERAWMSYFQPMKFANRLWVCPSGQEQHEEGCVCLTLDPGLAFGTGTHPTTALCLEWLAAHSVQDKTVIDYGCGSGILAVAGLLMGAEQAYCIDIDPQALEATRYNAAKNSVTDRMACFLPDQFAPRTCDIVLANILAEPLIELAGTISALVNPGGRLILSGILDDQARSVSAVYHRHGFAFNAPVTRDDWCRLDGMKSV